MKPKSIGIIGGAGPQAGAFLLQKVLMLANKKYGCYRDQDYPKILLLSFPFSEMLSPTIEAATIKEELKGCLNQLRMNGASILAIACNTLHAFLDENDEYEGFIHLPRIVAKAIPLNEIPLILCTSTSAKFGLHRRFLPCVYPNKPTQKRVDEIIDQILQGLDQEINLKQLDELIRAQEEKTVILGCTELSLYKDMITVPSKTIIDPLDRVAQKILDESFSNNRS